VTPALYLTADLTFISTSTFTSACLISIVHKFGCLRQLCCARCESVRKSVYKVRVKLERGASKNKKRETAAPVKGLSYQHIPGEGVLPEDNAWEQSIAVDLTARCDYLVFV